MPYKTLARPPYANHTVLSPAGAFLFFADTRKVGWYLERGLATVVVSASTAGSTLANTADTCLLRF